MMGLGLGLLGWIGRGKQLKEAAAAQSASTARTQTLLQRGFCFYPDCVSAQNKNLNGQN
jgi:hypothetical protein